MDPAIVHLIFSGALTLLFGGLGWLVKGFAGKVSDLEKRLNDHVVDDTRQFAELHARNDEIFRRLDDMKATLEKILEKLVK